MEGIVGIIGVGFVGENLAEVFSKKYKVIGYDISPKRITEMRMKFNGNRNIVMQTCTDNMEECDIFCIAVPTTLREDGTIDDDAITNAVDIINKLARPQSAVVMESSVHIGMTRSKLQHLREKDIYVGFSPERIDPGRVEPSVDNIHKIISGIDQISLEKVNFYYEKVFKNIVKVSTLETAELCKLSENCFRMINIAYANEMGNVCKNWNINVYEMINACATKPFGYMPFYPGLGVGGHCIPINPEWLAVTNRDDIPLLMSATKMMKDKPIMEAKKLVELEPNFRRILIVGIAFKPGESATTNSPGLEFANELAKHGMHITVYDPTATKENSIPFEILREDNWDAKYIDNNFDYVCVTIRQKSIKIHILKQCEIAKIINYCEY